MDTQFRMYRRRKSGFFYIENKITGKQSTLKTRDRAEAQRLVQAHNDAYNQSIFNLALARVYLTGADPELVTRTWQDVMNHIVRRRGGETRRRWTVAIHDKNFDCIRELAVAETRPEHFDQVLTDGKVSTNVYLRRIHNYALGMEWLLKSVLPKLLWPRPAYRKKRAIKYDEHLAILAREGNPERRDFYDLLWHTGASQGDAADLLGENINWAAKTISYSRKKLAGREGIQPALIRFGNEVAAILQRRPKSGPLFPYLRSVRPGDRATEFKQRCDGLGIEGISLHSYRYAWAERALKCGYPERFAQQALGHNSKAVHHAYSKNAEVIVPSLEDWEFRWKSAQPVVEVLHPVI
jgi:integrase